MVVSGSTRADRRPSMGKAFIWSCGFRVCALAAAGAVSVLTSCTSTDSGDDGAHRLSQALRKASPSCNGDQCTVELKLPERVDAPTIALYSKSRLIVGPGAHIASFENQPEAL